MGHGPIKGGIIFYEQVTMNGSIPKTRWAHSCENRVLGPGMEFRSQAYIEQMARIEMKRRAEEEELEPLKKRLLINCLLCCAGRHGAIRR
ncbi:hypothetical protein K470DRAFT_105796 [Piedraia hortae CBS 480.64]|uniref:Uncharacterized protein n=1 Tax=Piedraia hortae CBS 480.64 TaxID=1314780 RepID=A0A6A7C7R7_9PEZI|nr:hypothetical protein K470DRAFT_105796 [Piedraia hortae CBS 480.64]